MSVDSLTASPRPRTFRAGWGWLLLSTGTRFYLVFMGALAACALLAMLFGLSGSVVQSGSMEPHINPGDVVLSHPLPAKAPAPMGKVITFRAPTGASKSSLVLHRLVATNPNGSLVTAGDANANPDSTPLARRNIISQGCLLIPWIGLPSLWVTTGAFLWLGLWVLLTMVALMIEAVDLASSQPPAEKPPAKPEGPTGSGSGPDPEPCKAALAVPPPRQPISALLKRTALLKGSARLRRPALLRRIRVDTGSAGVALVALFTAVALAMAPLGLAAAAFTARAVSTGNTWNTAGPATQLDFTSDPSDATGGTAFTTQPEVAVLDAAGDTVGVSNAPVSLSITTPAGATLSCAANPQAAASGVATFAGCKIDKVGTYTLTASSGTLTSAVSASFTVTAGSATKLAFATSPSFSNSGVAFAIQPVVAVRDAGGNIVPTSTAPVTLSITTPAGATLSCTQNPKAAVAGLATFAGCSINNPGTYTLTAASAGLAGAVSASFVISVGTTTQLAFTTNPSSSTGGIAFGTQPVVAVQDAAGHTVPTSTAPVTLVITTPAGATLTCATNPLNAVAGVATFAGCGVDKPGTYTLTATSLGLTNAVSASFTITVGPAARLAFTAAPSNTTAAIVFGTQPVVAVLDAGSNTVTTSTASVTLSITTPAGATLSCTANPTNAVSGVVTFAGCSIGKSGTYTLTAAASGLTNAVSTTFTITAGPATKLAFTANPSSSTSTSVFGTQPVVAIQDAGGNTVTTSSATVTLSITTPAGATLACATNPLTAFLGVTTFAGCKIDKAGTYTLTAVSGGLTNAVSTSFTISVGPATKLGFTVTPSSTAVNTAFSAQPKVAIQDAGGNTVTTSSASVLLAITPPAGGATLTNCSVNPRSTTSGVATFASCRISSAGTYTLTATATGLTTATSASFSVFGPAAKLAFTTSPSGSTGATAFTTQPVVAIQDAGGNMTTGTNSVTLTITTPAGAILTCTANPKAAVAGSATFAGCKIDKAGTYTLTAAATGLTSATSASFAITVGSATKLAFTTSPSTSTSSTAFASQPVVAVLDAGGNTVTTSATAVTLTITTPAGATLTCTSNPTNAIAGVVTFAGCSIDKTGTYTLTAAAGGLTNAVSTSFVISAGTATKLAFTTNPASSTGGVVFGTQPVVAVQDVTGNTVTTSSASVTLTITTPAGSTLTCTTNPRTTSSGVATFAGCKIDKPGTYTLTAAASGLTSAVSTSLTITVGPAAKLGFTASPSSTTGGTVFGTQPVVAVQDAGGNTVTTSSAAVTLTITTPNGATLTCNSNPTNAVAGVAAFAGCKIGKSGTYTLTAASSGLTNGVSTSFTITVGTATKLAFTTSPVGSAINVAFATQPVVAVQDAGGNTVSSTTSITLSITSGGGATLTCTANPKAAVSGVATFAGCRINTAGTYTLTAQASGGLTSAVSTSFTITATLALAAAAAPAAPSTPSPAGPAAKASLPATPAPKSLPVATPATSPAAPGR